MPYFKHYSFDLWLTLIKSNPLFKIERTQFFYDNFNATHKSLDEVALIFRQVDVMCNTINEKTGKNIDADEMYLMVINMINNFNNNFDNIDTEKLYNQMETLLFEHLPFVYSNETITVLKHLKQNANCTMNILSNTGFIKGQTLRKVLAQIGLSPFFDFQLYSDEEQLSKPNPKFFNLMLDKVSYLPLNEIVHVGDNPKADIAGANLMGLNSVLINSNSLTINTLICSKL